MIPPWRLRALLVGLLPLLTWLAAAAEPTEGPLVASRQALLVVTPDWDSNRATMVRFQRETAGNWQPVAGSFPVVLGEHGLAWGRGLHPDGLPGPQKREGDRRAPAGVFRLSQLFGIRQPEFPPGALPYRPLGPDTAGVDDPHSRYYNRIVDPGGEVVPDWDSAEHMYIPDYRLGIVVDHNVNPPVPGGGSCIFIHLWVAPDVGTAGCTATSYSNMRALSEWLRRDANPVLVQLPRVEYDHYRADWGLP